MQSILCPILRHVGGGARKMSNCRQKASLMLIEDLKLWSCTLCESVLLNVVNFSFPVNLRHTKTGPKQRVCRLSMADTLETILYVIINFGRTQLKDYVLQFLPCEIVGVPESLAFRRAWLFQRIVECTLHCVRADSSFTVISRCLLTIVIGLHLSRKTFFAPTRSTKLVSNGILNTNSPVCFGLPIDKIAKCATRMSNYYRELVYTLPPFFCIIWFKQLYVTRHHSCPRQIIHCAQASYMRAQFSRTILFYFSNQNPTTLTDSSLLKKATSFVIDICG